MTHQFKWTRARYRTADRMYRRQLRHGWCGNSPKLVKRYLELWEKYPQKTDPLSISLKFRADWVPF